MDLLQQTVRPISRFIARDDFPNLRIKHSFRVLFDTDGFTPLPAFVDDLYLPIVLTLSLQNSSKRSNGEDLPSRRLVYGCVMLGREKNVAVTGHRLLESAD